MNFTLCTNKFPVLLFILFCKFASAQTSIPANTIITENFNSIGVSPTSALPANWKMSSAGTGTAATWAAGTNITSTTQAANSGAPVSGGVYNWATASATDRAIGFMASAGYGSPNSIMGYYRNTTGATVTTITVSFAIERYRINTSSFTLNFFSSTDGSTWTARTSGDISSSAFATAASSYSFSSPQIVTRTVTISGLNIANNGDFYLRWLFTDGAAATAQGLGLDDVSLFAGAATPVIIAKLADQLSIDNGILNQANSGDQLTYTTTIRNIGTGDATNVTLTEPAPVNTTLTGGVTTSALARNDSYTTALNTALTGNNVLTNDFGLPSPTVVSFGPSASAAATAAGGTGISDNGGTVVLNSNGTFTYMPATGFSGVDKFSYIATTGTAPDNEATVTITVGAAVTANADSYSIIGNVSISPNVAAGIIANDGGSGILITAVNGSAANIATNTSTTQGGTVNVAANGSFTYNPPAGFEGVDNFTYTIDNGFGVPATATVTLNISGMIWFVNNSAAAGDGRLSSPFNTLAALSALNNGAGNNPGANDYIFIYESATDYFGNLTLMNGQKLIGQDAGASVATITGFTVPSYSASLPVTNSANGIIVNITATAASTNALTANATGGTNVLRGFTIGNKTGTGINGSNFGTLTVSELSITGTGQALSLNTGTLSATISSLSSGSGITAVSLTAVGGTLIINGGTISGSTGTAFAISGGTVAISCAANITQANNAALLSISGGHGTGTVTFNTGTLSATNGSGLQFDNADGTYNFNGTTTLNGGDAGIDILNGSAGTFNFGTGTAITSPSGVGFNIGGVSASTCNVTYSGSITQANNAAMVNISNGHNSGTVTFQTGTLSATNGTGLRFDDADGVYNFNGTATLNGGDAGIDILNGSAGNFSFLNAPITNPTGTAFNVSGGGGSISHAGAISKTSAGRIIDIQSRTGGSVTLTGNLSSTVSSTGINVSGNSGGTITFSGSTKTLNTPGFNSVNLSSNTGATINFTGGNLAITSTTATGFNATGGGTISVQGTVNTITSTTGTALNIANTTISASGLTFQSISSNGSTSGIVLNTTGSSAGLTVTGTGSAGSGGTIQNTTGHGISLTNTTSPSFAYLNIQNTSGSGIKGTTTVNFSCSNSTINNSGTGGGTDESNIAFNTTSAGTENNLSGIVTISNNTLNNARYHGITIFNFNGTISNATISSNTILSGTTTTTSLGSGIMLIAFGSASTAANVTQAVINNNSIINFPSGAGIQAQGGNANAAGPASIFGVSGSLTDIIAITGNQIRGNSPATTMGTSAIITLVNGKGQGNFNISNNGTLANPITNIGGTVISNSAFGAVTVTSVINNNFIVANNFVGSQGIGAGLDNTFGITDAPNLTLTINNNNISGTDGNGILATARNSAGVMRAKIQNNVIGAPIGGVRPGIRVDAGSASGNVSVCLNLSGNTSAGSGGTNGIGLRKQGTVSTINAFGVNGMAATGSPGIESYINGLNPAGNGTLLISATTGFSSCVNN